MATGKIQKPENRFDVQSIDGNASHTFTLTPSNGYMLVISGTQSSNSQRKGLYLVYDASAGGVTITNLLQSSVVTMDTGTANKLKVTASAVVFATLIKMT